MTRLLISAVVFFGVWYGWGYFHGPGWAPLAVLGHAISIRVLVAVFVTGVAYSKMGA